MKYMALVLIAFGLFLMFLEANAKEEAARRAWDDYYAKQEEKIKQESSRYKEANENSLFNRCLKEGFSIDDCENYF